MSQTSYLSGVQRREALWAIGLAILNLAVLILVGRIDSQMGSPVRVHEFAMFGIGAGHLCLAIFTMSFAHLRGWLRFPLCNLFVLASVQTCHLGLVSTYEFFRRASTDILAHHQVYFIGALWSGFTLLVMVRAILRLEFGFVSQDVLLPPRSLQFRITAMALFSAIVGVACVLIRMLLGFYLQSNSTRSVPTWEIALPFVVLGGVLIATAPILFTALLRRRARVWITLAIVWGCIPLYVLDPPARPFYSVLYAAFWLTVIANLLVMRLIGFRWLPTENVRQT